MAARLEVKRMSLRASTIDIALLCARVEKNPYARIHETIDVIEVMKRGNAIH